MRLYPLLLFLLLSHVSNAQPFVMRGGFSSISRPDSMYPYYYNRLLFSTPNASSCDSIDFRNDSLFNVKRDRRNKCLFYVRPLFDSGTAYLYQKDSIDFDGHPYLPKHEIAITKTSMPYPWLKFINKTGLGPSNSKVLTPIRNAGKIFCLSPYYDIDNRKIRYKVLAYELKVYINEKMVYKTSIISDHLPTDLYDRVKSIKPKDKLTTTFTNILIENDLGKRMTIPEQTMVFLMV